MEGFDLVALTNQIAEVAGIVIADFGKASQQQLIVREWAEWGASPDQIRTAIESRRNGKSVSTLRYFDGAIRDVLEAKKTEASEGDRLADRILAEAAKRKAAQ